MSASTVLRDTVTAKLAPLPVTSRAMFGGFGLYLDGAFFAVISDGVLYFRTDDGSRVDYVERGMQPLQPKHRPRGPKTVDRHFEVPADVFADDGMLHEWAVRAAATSQPKRRGRAPDTPAG